MFIVRALTLAVRPALVGGAVTAAAAGGWFAIDRIRSDAPPTAFRAIQGQQRLLVAEFGERSDRIVAIDPADVSGARSEIASVDHAPGYGSFASLAPRGDAIAYTALPADAAKPGPATPATLGVIGVDGAVTVLADDVDLLVTPVWSPDAQAVVARKNTPCDDSAACGAGTFELLRLGRDGSRATLTTWRSAAVFPIAFSPDGARVYFATLGPDGSDLYAVGRDGSGETKLARLSDQITRDWKLSPSGATLAYSVAEGGDAPAVVTKVLNLLSGAVEDAVASDSLAAGPPSTGVARGEFSPAWDASGRLTIAQLNLDGGAGAVTVEGGAAPRAVTAGDATMDLPLGWSPDGGTLAVRSVEGETPFDAGASRVELIAGASRERVSDSADVQVVGWTRG